MTYGVSILSIWKILIEFYGTVPTKTVCYLQDPSHLPLQPRVPTDHQQPWCRNVIHRKNDMHSIAILVKVPTGISLIVSFLVQSSCTIKQDAHCCQPKGMEPSCHSASTCVHSATGCTANCKWEAPTCIPAGDYVPTQLFLFVLLLLLLFHWIIIATHQITIV